jgi:hypothetical protein
MAMEGEGRRLERWRAERLWRRAAELEAAARDSAALAAPDGAGRTGAAGDPDAVELSTALAAALEGGLDPAAVARSARLELVLGTLDAKEPNGFERWAARANRVPDPPLASAGTSSLSPAAFLAAFEAATANDQYGLSFVEGRALGDGAELRVYEVASNWDTATRPFRDRLRTYASVKSLAVVAEPDGTGGTRFELLADTRRSARVYGASLAGTAAVLAGAIGALGFFVAGPLALPAAAAGAGLGAAAAWGLHRLVGAYAFPAARKQLDALARTLSIRTGGDALPPPLGGAR